MNKPKNRPTTVRVPEWVNKALATKVIADGYGMRGKSKWVEEAVHNLLKSEELADEVHWDSQNELDGSEKTVNFSFSKATYSDVDQAIAVIRSKYPKMEGVKSHIIRTAILRRIQKN